MMRFILSFCFLFICSTSAFSSIILAVNKQDPDIKHWAVAWDCNTNSTLYTGILAKQTVENAGYATAYTRPKFPFGTLTSGVMTVLQITNSDNQVSIGLGADASSYVKAREEALEHLMIYNSSSFKSTDPTTIILEQSFSCNSAEPEYTSGGISDSSAGGTITTPIDTGTTTSTPSGSSGNLIDVAPYSCTKNTLEPIKINQLSGGNELVIVSRGGANDTITSNRMYYMENGTCEDLSVTVNRYTQPGPAVNLKYSDGISPYRDIETTNNLSKTLTGQYISLDSYSSWTSQGYFWISLSETESSVSSYADGCHKIDYVITASTAGGKTRVVNTFVGFCIGNDIDGDGTIDPLDNDMDNDGVVNEVDAFPKNSTESKDNDNDGIGDNADTDDDNDGLLDTQENAIGTDPFNSDTDGDGVIDGSDAFPLDPSESLDTDADGIGNNTDTDDDGDSVLDTVDAFPLDPTEWVDSDFDGVGDNSDVFPMDASESADTDGDGVGDNADAFPLDASETVDSDGDGVGDNSDVFPQDASESADSDGDGVGDNSDPFPFDSAESVDTDNDGIGNTADTDDDNDGLPDRVEVKNALNPTDPTDAEADLDGDGQANIIEYTLGSDMNDANSKALNSLGTGVVTEDFEYGLDPLINWRSPSAKDWVVTTNRSHSGSYSAEAPLTLGNRERSDLSATLFVNDGEVTFWHMANSNQNYLIFYIDGVQVGAWTSTTWTYTSFPVTAGIHTFTWQFMKYDYGTLPAIQTEWLDDIQFPVNANDSDNDGVGNSVDAFPANPNERFDSDGDGLGNNTDTDDDNDGVIDSQDEMPLNPDETLDSDADGVGDNSDALPLDDTESIDTDNDGVGNNADNDDDNDGVLDADDAFPLDSAEWVDSDNDGVGDNADPFPNDSTEWADTDGDGLGDNADIDADGDGYDDNQDSFPTDSTEWVDSDADGVGDNADAFLLDPTEWLDSDGDGVGDNADALPLDASESVDTDGDGTGDIADAYPLDPSEWIDTDGDGIGDNADAYPLDATRSLASSSDSGGGTVAPVVLAYMVMLLYWRRRQRCAVIVR